MYGGEGKQEECISRTELSKQQMGMKASCSIF